MDPVANFAYAAITLFLIMDPLLSIGPFLALTRKLKGAERTRSADNAIIVAGVLAVIFLVAGPYLLLALGISLSSFRVAGGIVLGLLGLQMVLNFSIGNKEPVGGSSVAALIGTPLLTGPGLLTALVILSQQYGPVTAIAGLLVALAASWTVLRQAQYINRLAGTRIVEVFSRVMGLMLVAVAVEFVRAGIAG